MSGSAEKAQSLVRFSCQEGADDETAKKSNRRLHRQESKRRTKFMLEGVRKELYDLQRENEALRIMVREHITPMDLAERILSEAEASTVDIYLQCSVLMDEEYQYQCPPDERNHHKVQALKSIQKQKIEKNDTALRGSIPRVLSVPNLSIDKMRKGPEENIIRSSIVEEVESLAAALSGDFAF